jgi:ketosteroid isomerase-like protein
MGDAKVKTIEQVYEAFGRGDVDAILALVTDDVDWASEAESKVAPWHGTHKGKGEVAKFFETLGGAVEVTEFTPLAFASNDTDVMVVVRFGMKVLATGKSGEMDLHHWFRFRDGKIERYRGTEDTALTAALLRK